LVEFRRSYRHKDEMWKASVTTMFSVTENSIAIIVACLPPLRRTFDDFLKRILPESLLAKLGATQSLSNNDALNSHYTRNKSKPTRTSMEDDESEVAILPDAEYVENSQGRIVRTTKVVVTNESCEFRCGRGKATP
jgi:hypothetical protein